LARAGQNLPIVPREPITATLPDVPAVTIDQEMIEMPIKWRRKVS
jgi:hypothetical protein